MNRPILDNSNPGQTPERDSVAPPSPPQPQEPTLMPIAQDLPAWDLVPADTLIVRRRPVKR